MSTSRVRGPNGRFVATKPEPASTPSLVAGNKLAVPTVAKPATDVGTASAATVARTMSAPSRGWPAGTAAWSAPTARKLSVDELDRMTSAAITRRHVSVLAALVAFAAFVAVLAYWIGSGDMSRTMAALPGMEYAAFNRAMGAKPAVEHVEPVAKSGRWLLTMATNVAGFANEISVETGSASECIAVGETMRRLRAAVGNPDCMLIRN